MYIRVFILRRNRRTQTDLTNSLITLVQNSAYFVSYEVEFRFLFIEILVRHEGYFFLTC